ncbi:MAG TPA: PKD domain-containing protein [Acidobacteriota bacterium]|nr:PKD domain-containing protein [Acidobacteriota bacterium]
MRLILGMGLAVLMTFGGPVALAANHVEVESKTVSSGAIGATVGVFIENDVDLATLVVPLEIREVDAGSYIAGSLALTVQGRVAASGLTDFTILLYYPTPSAQTCSGPITNTYTDQGAIDFVSPDAVVWVGLKTSSPCLEPGSDGGTPSILLTFDVTGAPGSFVIDTCCTWPNNHLTFLECVTEVEIPPTFTAGTIEIALNECPIIEGFEYDPVVVMTGNHTENSMFASDLEGDPIEYYLLYGPGTVNTMTGEWMYDAACWDVGSNEVRIGATDRGIGECDEWSFLLEVLPFPPEPYCTDVVVTCGEVADQLITVFGGCPPYAFAVISGPGMFDSPGHWFWEPTCEEVGSYPVEIVVSDGYTEVYCAFTVEVTEQPVLTCPCACHSDPQCDSVTNVLDVVTAVNVAFRSAPPVFDPGCTYERTDVDCSGFTNVIDVVRFVNVAFRGGDYYLEFTFAGSLTAPSPRIIFPPNGTIMNGLTVFVADETNPCLTPYDILYARFEYSLDESIWHFLDEQYDLMGDSEGPSPGIWDAGWDLSPMPSGPLYVRVVMETYDEVVGTSPSVMIINNLAPIAHVTVEGDSALVSFDASGSEDLDGAIVSWQWDFGDGSYGSGPIVDHYFLDLDKSSNITVELTDDYGTSGWGIFRLTFAPAVLEVADGCICDAIALRGDNLPAEGTAFGPDGVVGGTNNDWGTRRGQRDGTTLGPLNGNPQNTAAGTTEKPFTGYAFEVVADVTGNPALCREIQVRKSSSLVQGTTQAACAQVGGTWEGGGTCRLAGRWGLRASTNFPDPTQVDLDLDGTNDITQATNPEFPVGGTQFGPDGSRSYREPVASLKAHPDSKIVYSDAPRFGGGCGELSTYVADFIFLVRGTDNKYCYVAFTINLVKRTDPIQDGEQLLQTGTGVGVTAVPGVP